MKPLLYALPDNESFAVALARAWPAEIGALTTHQFPDGETMVRLAGELEGRHVALVCTLNQPEPRALPLLFAAATARDLGARSIGLVAPYLAYMRQDQAFHPGESVSASHFARLLSSHFDWLATVDPHLHRVHSLREIYPIPTVAVPAAPLLGRWIAQNVERPLLIGPDEESRQWITRIADEARAPWLVFEKHRAGDRAVEIAVPDMARWRGHTPVIADDIVSTGATLIELVRRLRAQGLPPPACVVVHAVFSGHAYHDLLNAGAGHVVTTNAIGHVSNAIDLADAMAAACRSLVPGSRKAALPRAATQ